MSIDSVWLVALIIWAVAGAGTLVCGDIKRSSYGVLWASFMVVLVSKAFVF